MKEQNTEPVYGFLGAGNMASAIIGGIGGKNVCVYDVNPAQYEKFSDMPHVRTAATPRECAEAARYLFLCVKPQNFEALLTDLRDCDLRGKTVVSIAAGISTDAICRCLGRQEAVIRTMPNTPLLIGRGVTALSRNALVSDADFAAVSELFSACGAVFTLPEDKMNAVIAATSTAPAYVYLLISAIAHEAAREGVSPEGADMTEMIARMIIGSAHMVLESGKTPDELITMVKSPKGTTEQALLSLERDGFCDVMARAMQACTARAEELGKTAL